MRPIVAGFFVAAVALGACSGAHEPRRDHAARAAAPGRNTPGVDVPALLTLSIDELSKRVGPAMRPPPDFVDPTLAPLAQRSEVLDSLALFRRSGLAIVAAYDYHTRHVNDLLLLGTNENELMNRARLQLGAEHYLVLPVFQAKRPTQLMGLRVLPLALNQ